MFLNLPCLLLGRFLNGLSVGLFCSITPRFIEETCPNHVYGSLIALWKFALAMGGEIAYILGEILPSDTDIEALEKTENWRIIFLYFPLGLYVLFALLLRFFITYEPIKYNITKGNN